MVYDLARKDSRTGVFDHNTLADFLFNKSGFTESSRFAVGFSGGADSTALLLALSRVLGPDCSTRLVALHFNHRIHPDSNRWQAHCQAICKHLGIPMLAESWQRESDVAPTEALSREARYRWFQRVLDDGVILCLAQHRDDQVETVLMNLLEQRDLHRVSGIRPTRPLTFGDSRMVVRPLLGCTRSQLIEYVARAGVAWVEDPANQDITQRRAWLRHEVLPQLRTGMVDLDERVAASARVLQRAVSLLDRSLRRELGVMIAPEHRRIFCLAAPLCIAKLACQEPSNMLSLLRTWIHDAALDSPGNKALGHLVASLAGSTDTHHLAWRHGAVRGYRGFLYLLGPLPDRGGSCPWTIGRKQLADGLQVETVASKESAAISGDIQGVLRWCWRQGGESVRLPGRSHGTTMKKACQQIGIPPWERDYLPFLSNGSEVLWMHGIGWCGLMADVAKESADIDFEPRMHWRSP